MAGNELNIKLECEIERNSGSQVGDKSVIDNIQAIQDWQVARSRLVSYVWPLQVDPSKETLEELKDINNDPKKYLTNFGCK